MTYQEAYDIIKTQGKCQIRPEFNDSELKQNLFLGLNSLFELSKLMRKTRFDNGSLVLDSPEIDFKLDANGNPIDV